VSAALITLLVLALFVWAVVATVAAVEANQRADETELSWLKELFARINAEHKVRRYEDPEQAAWDDLRAVVESLDEVRQP
jgi:hypothetical protein